MTISGARTEHTLEEITCTPWCLDEYAHRLRCLDIWSPAGGAVLARFRKCGLAGRSMSQSQAVCSWLAASCSDQTVNSAIPATGLLPLHCHRILTL